MIDYKKLPHSPGVYTFLGEKGKVLYVGKAKDLRKRVSQYFQKKKDTKTNAIIKNLVDIKYLITDNEEEALILECSLIKNNKPRYNIDLKDDKTYPYVRISKDDYPRVFVTRRVVDDGSEYFGPYTKARELKKSIRFIRGLLGIRTCRNFKSQPCLNYHLKRCLGPCTKNVNKKEYNNRVKLLRKFLGGKYSLIIKELKRNLELASKNRNYELAKSYRDKIFALESIIEKQKMVLGKGNFDVLSISRLERRVGVMIFFVRNGKVVGSEFFSLKNAYYETDEVVLGDFIKLYYYKREDAPNGLVVKIKPNDSNLISKTFGFKLRVPKRGRLYKLLDLVLRNGESLKEELLKENFRINATRELKDVLGLKKVPRNIEGIDISNISGMLATGSIVRFLDSIPLKGGYKRFRIKEVEDPDDYEMMREVIYRRYRDKKDLPDLLVIDGGKGQLNACLKVLEELDLKLPCVAIAKSFEHLFIKGKEGPIILQGKSSALKLVQRIRDEAHRFAISYHKYLRSKAFK
jgi:excinuclease ABC subunit C